MSGMIEIVHPGFGCTVQDSGRRGHRHEGMPQSGWLDATLAEAANALVGNNGGEAVVELRGMGTELRVQAGPVRVALAGAVAAKWLRVDGSPTTLRAWQSATLQTGDRLQLGVAETGCAYMALSGGCRLPLALGSRSSYGRAGLPGVLGRALRPGDVLPCSQWRSPDPKEWRVPTPWTPAEGPIRVMLGPQQDHFTAEAVASFLNEEWQVTAEQDRMGMRLRGAPLQHVNSAAADIVSDAVAPGTIQVPANGQPIVLLADSQTVGGYPKIATVITADLPRLAHLQPGAVVRFQAVNSAQAQIALLDQSQTWKRWVATREAFVPPGFIDHEALYANNLISGMLCAET